MMAGLILRNRIRSSDIQDTVRVELLYVERSIWSGCLHDVSAERFLAQKEYLEASPRQDVSHVGQEHLCFLLEEVGGLSYICEYIVFFATCMHGVSYFPFPKVVVEKMSLFCQRRFF